MIKYMKTFGFRVNNDAFEKKSWYFRNGLVRANCNELQNGVHASTKFLEMFFSNLILVEADTSQSAKFGMLPAFCGDMKIEMSIWQKIFSLF